MDALEALGPLALNQRSTPEPANLEQAAREFEGLMLGTIQRNGAKPMGGEHMLDGGSAGRMAREMWLQELSSIAVRNGGLGISKLFEARESLPEDPAR